VCDPLSIGLAVAGVAGSAMQSAGAMKAQKRQEREVNIWQQQQNKAREAEQVRQEQMRQGANQSREQGLAQMAGENQQARQAKEEARLAAYLTGGEGSQTATQEPGGAPVSVADARLTGQQDTGDDSDRNFQTDLAKKISDASKGAKQRLGALARVSSYGESFGGLGTENPLIQQESGAGIDKFNEFRRGSMAAYGLEKAINPVQVTYTPSPIATALQTIGSIGSYGMGASAAGGKGVGSLFGGKVGANIAGSAADPWKGLRVGKNMTGLF
jgi:hypothetical protein